MNRIRSLTILVLLAFVATSLAGCMADPDRSDDEDAETGTVTMYVKDAATDDFSEIWVSIEQVEVHIAPGSVNGTGDDEADPEDNETATETQSVFEDNETATEGDNETEAEADNETATHGDNETENEGDNETADGDGSRGGWTLVVDTPRDLDLMSFSENDSKAFLGEAELQAGKYTQIRLHISQAWGIRADDGEREEIAVVNSPVKVVKSFDVNADSTTQVVIDIDLDRSVRPQGPPHDPHGWRMTPVIGKAQVTEDVEDDPRQDQSDDESGLPEGEEETGIEDGNQTGDQSGDQGENETGQGG